MSALTGATLSSTSGPETPGIPKEQQPEDIPRPTQDALDFLLSLEEDDYRHIQFDDDLVTVSDTGKELGEFHVSVSPAKHEGAACYLVHANSHGSIDSVPCGTSITAYVNAQLETLEQQHHEYVKLENHPLDRKTFIVKQPDGFVINRVVTQGEEIQRSTRNFSPDKLRGFISEGSNLLLQRLLIKKGIPNNFQLIAFDSDTNICPVSYRELEKRTQVVGQEQLEVRGLERTISSLADLPTTWQAYLTNDGHLASRVQVGSPVTMRLLRAPTAMEEEEQIEKPTFGKKDLNWEEDMELKSKFLARKEELQADHALYMRAHPELKALLADFTQFLLLRKPNDVLEFAAEYFASFSAKMADVAPHCTSGAPTPHPESRSNSRIQYLSKAT